MTPPRSPRQLLADAKVVESQPNAVPTATWGRAVAVLARQAMERALTEYWQRTEPEMARSRNQRAAFLCLRNHLPPEAAADAYYSWSALSRACHFNGYDLEPAAEEVGAWIEGAERFLEALESASTIHQPVKENA